LENSNDINAPFSYTNVTLLSFSKRGSKLKIRGFRFKVRGSRFKVQGSRLGFKVSGFRFKVGVHETLNLEL
jgi:hypothetical protein